MPLIHVSQMLDSGEFEVKFFGISGKDDAAGRIKNIVGKTFLNISNYQASSGRNTPFTDVLSDPDYENGHGENFY